MIAMNTDETIDAQLQNWNNFCKYHTGDWHGTWTKYSSDGETLESFQCIRSFHVSIDGSEINHQNYYIYVDGKTEIQTFGPYKKPNTRALYLDSSFSWGFITVEPGSPAFFETGFRYENRRASAVVVYDNSGKLQQLIIISECLNSFVEETCYLQAFEINGTWLGMLKKMTPERIVSPAVETFWRQLEDLGDNYQTLHFPNGISVSCPRQIEGGKELLLVTNWLANSTFLQRGIRHFNSAGFINFTLETFNKLS